MASLDGGDVFMMAEQFDSNNRLWKMRWLGYRSVDVRKRQEIRIVFSRFARGMGNTLPEKHPPPGG